MRILGIVVALALKNWRLRYAHAESAKLTPYAKWCHDGNFGDQGYENRTSSSYGRAKAANRFLQWNEEDDYWQRAHVQATLCQAPALEAKRYGALSGAETRCRLPFRKRLLMECSGRNLHCPCLNLHCVDSEDRAVRASQCFGVALIVCCCFLECAESLLLPRRIRLARVVNRDIADERWSWCCVCC